MFVRKISHRSVDWWINHRASPPKILENSMRNIVRIADNALFELFQEYEAKNIRDKTIHRVVKASPWGHAIK